MRFSGKSVITLFASALALSVIAAPAKAFTTFTVTGTGEPAAVGTNDCSAAQCVTLRGAINAAGSGDTIVFNKATLDGKTINLTLFSNDLGSTEFGPSAFFIPLFKTLTIDATANGLTQGVTIARSAAGGTARFRLFDIASFSSLSLRGLTLRNGLAQGGDSDAGGGALGAGGAIFNQGTLTLQQCTLAGNVAQGGRGATGSISAPTGGGGVGQTAVTGSGGGPNGGPKGTDVLYSNGDGGPGGTGALGGGGGAGGYGDFGAGPDQIGNGGDGGYGGFGGGGGGGARGYVNGVMYGAKAGSGGGGGFGAGGGSSNVVPVPGNNGSGGFGAGAAAYNKGGSGGGMGGAIFNDAGTVTLTNVTLAQNHASGGGNSTAGAGNGSGYGGAIFNYAGIMTLSFVTASDNAVAAGTGGTGGNAGGGAIFSLGDTLSHCSGGGNACPTGGIANVTISDSIAANSTGTAIDIVSHSSYADSTVYVPSTTTLTGTLALGALPATLRGGLVDVMIPPAGSTAIDAAGAGPCAASTDQRGVSRPQGAACDIGAVEVDTIFSDQFDAIAPAPLM